MVQKDDEREFYLHCSECGGELKPGDMAVAATCGSIEADGGFYVNDMEPWLWVKHSECPKKEADELFA